MFPGAALDVGGSDGPVWQEALGTLAFDQAASPAAIDTPFDLASLTKPIVTATVFMRLVAAGAVVLDERVSACFPEWTGDDRTDATVGDLLEHASGLPPRLLDMPPGGRREFEHDICATPLEYAPHTRSLYSDLGFIALGTLLRRLAGRSLARAVEAPLCAWGATATAYSPRGPERNAIPATETDAWRGSVQGGVHDEKAHLMGGVSGHAGLFGTARDVALLGEWYLGALYRRRSPLDRDLVCEAVREQAREPTRRRGLGWVLRTGDEAACGSLMSPSTFGHGGFTGTSIWVDPERDLNVVLLTNAVHHGRSDIRPIRAAVADAAVAAIERR